MSVVDQILEVVRGWPQWQRTLLRQWLSGSARNDPDLAQAQIAPVIAALQQASPNQSTRIARWLERLESPPMPAARSRGSTTMTPLPPELLPDEPAKPPALGTDDQAASSRHVSVVFDGGSQGNPGRGYGSYALTWKDRRPAQITRVQFGDGVTNNEAEYDTLLAALHAILTALGERNENPKDWFVSVKGDSQLVIFQVQGRWQARDARMAERRTRVRALLEQFGGYSLRHHARANSVKVLGH